MSNIQPSIKGFYGRAQERAWLRGLFEEVADVDHETGRSRGGPKLAVIVANTGLGKSRLVQTLYQELTIDSKWDPEEANYWPDAFQDAGKIVASESESQGARTKRATSIHVDGSAVEESEGAQS